MNKTILPIDYGVLHHQSWRPGQLEAVQWARQGGVRILEAPTGSGKTATARAFANGGRSVALCRTRFLQRDNYEGTYGYVPLYGRSNYACVHPNASMFQTADECFHRGDMRDCSVYAYCPYVQARDAAKRAPQAVLNYALWMYQRDKWGALDSLVLDEAHQLPDMTIEFAGIHVSEKTRQKFGMAPFELLMPGFNYRGMGGSSVDRAYEWAQESLKTLKRKLERLKATAKSVDEMKETGEVERMCKKLEMTIAALNTSREGWYVKSMPFGEMRCVPLTARYHFRDLFITAESVLIMSATIGDPETFAKELGLHAWQSRAVPHPYPPVMRQILDIKAPRMGQKSTPADYERQAQLIVDVIKAEAQPDWSGLVLVTRKQEAHDMAMRLARLGLGHRVWSTTTQGTDKIVSAWDEQRKRRPGSIFVTHALWEGYDGTDEKICVVAKVPYPNIGDEYEKMRQMYDGKLFLQRAAWQMEQGLGRTRRGRPEDYDSLSERRGLVVIADGNWTRVRNYLSAATREAITEWKQ